MITEDQRKAIVDSASILRVRGLDVDCWVEVDDLTYSAYLVFSVKGNLPDDIRDLVAEFRETMDPALQNEVIDIYASTSKGRGRPKKTGAPPAEGLIIRCVLK